MFAITVTNSEQRNWNESCSLLLAMNKTANKRKTMLQRWKGQKNKTKFVRC